MLNHPSTATPIPSPCSLALQGGGAHGAFTWGVLDRLLERGTQVSAVSGVSSGAILGTMLVQGLVEGGAEGARAQMRRLWERVSGPSFTPLPPEALRAWMWGFDAFGDWGASLGQSLLWQGMDAAMRLFSPAQINPFGHHPLRVVLDGLLDRALLTHPSAPRLTVAATDVETGRATLFGNAEIDTDVLLASSCLPFVFPAVEMRGRAYWDGGYSGNPPLGPLIGSHLPREIVLVRAQPARRPGVPRTPSDIFNRMHEIAFHTALAAEIAALPPGVRLTTFNADAALLGLPIASKMDASAAAIAKLFQAGRAACADASDPLREAAD
jgi:NTE family protein